MAEARRPTKLLTTPPPPPAAPTQTVSATPRQLESLIRLSEGLARMRLAPYVTVADVAEAVRLMRVALQQSSVDPRTGQIDMDVIQTGISAADRTLRAALGGELRALLDQMVRGWRGRGRGEGAVLAPVAPGPGLLTFEGKRVSWGRCAAGTHGCSPSPPTPSPPTPSPPLSFHPSRPPAAGQYGWRTWWTASTARPPCT